MRSTSMKKNEDHLEIMLKLGLLEAGQNELIRRVGIQNGRVADTETHLASLDVALATMKGERKGITVSWKFLLAIVTIAISIWGVLALFNK